MASYKAKRTSPYSEDLQMVWQREALGLKPSEVAVQLSVDPSTVRRIVGRFEQTGSIEKKRYPLRSQPINKLSSPVQFNIANLVLERPGIFLHEIQQSILEDHGEEIESSLCRFFDFSRKKLKIATSQRDDLRRAIFASDVSMYAWTKLEVIDGLLSGKMATAFVALVSSKFLSRGVRINTIAFMSVIGMLDSKTFRCTVDGDTF